MRTKGSRLLFCVKFAEQRFVPQSYWRISLSFTPEIWSNNLRGEQSGKEIRGYYNWLFPRRQRFFDTVQFFTTWARIRAQKYAACLSVMFSVQYESHAHVTVHVHCCPELLELLKHVLQLIRPTDGFIFITVLYLSYMNTTERCS